MESGLYLYLRCWKYIKSTSSLTRYVNICKISITLPSYQLSKPTVILEDNTTNYPDLLSDNNKESISLGISNHGEKRIRLADNDEKDIRPANINQQRPTTPHWTLWNGLLSELSRNFREITFSKSEFPFGTPVYDTRYEYPESQNNYLFYLFND